MVDYKKLNCALKVNLSLEVIRQARELFPDGLLMSSSLGRYSAVMLHLTTSLIPDIPVVNLRLSGETSHTARHREAMVARLNLNLKVYDVSDDKAGALQRALVAGSNSSKKPEGTGYIEASISASSAARSPSASTSAMSATGINGIGRDVTGRAP